MFLLACFRSASVCKHASAARDPVDVFVSVAQSESGGVCRWAWPESVAVKMSMDRGFREGRGPLRILGRRGGAAGERWPQVSRRCRSEVSLCRVLVKKLRSFRAAPVTNLMI